MSDVCVICGGSLYERPAGCTEDDWPQVTMVSIKIAGHDAPQAHAYCLGRLARTLHGLEPGCQIDEWCHVCGRRLRDQPDDRSRPRWTAPVTREATICWDCWGHIEYDVLRSAGLPPDFYRRGVVAFAARTCGTCAHQRTLMQVDLAGIIVGRNPEGRTRPVKCCCKSNRMMGDPPPAPDDWGCDDGWIPRPEKEDDHG